MAEDLLRLSIVIEWANTRLNGEPRAAALLDRLDRQWRELVARDYPKTLPGEGQAFLQRFAERAELVIVSSGVLSSGIERALRERLSGTFDVAMHVGEGLDYYPLKNFGANRAAGDILLFVDSDVLPDDGWLAHLVGTLGRPDVDVVCGQTYVAPTDLVAKAFALGWTYRLPDRSGKISPVRKFYANTIVFRTDVFREAGGFPPIGTRTRGAASLIGQELARRGIPVWENKHACVDHPPPSSFRHLAVRGLAHGRDQYMTKSEDRHLAGLARSVGIATGRMGRGVYRIVRGARQVGLRPWELPPAIGLCVAYHAFFALGGILTHVNPRAMGRRFRV